MLTRDSVSESEPRNIILITNCIGGGCTSSYVDLVQMTNDFYDGDIYLLCSDGLSDMVSDDRISELIANDCDADALCEEAIALGGYDNIAANTRK